MARCVILLCVLALVTVITAQESRQEIIRGTGLNQVEPQSGRRGIFRGHHGAGRMRSNFGHHRGGHHGGGHHGGGHHGGGHHGGGHHGGGHHGGGHHRDNWMAQLMSGIPGAGNARASSGGTLSDRHRELMERLRSHHAAQSSPRRYRRPGPGQRGSQTGVSHLTSMHHMDTRSERLQRQNGQLASLPTQEGVSDPFRDGGVQAIRVGPETGRFGHRRGRGHHRGHHGGHHGGHHRGGRRYGRPAPVA